MIVVAPTAALVARPFEPRALLIVAVAVVDEVQVATSVRSIVVSSLKRPVAVNCCR